MKYLILIMFLGLTACGDSENKPAFNLSGDYVEGFGTIDNQEIISMKVKDNADFMHIDWITENEIFKCTYPFFEELGKNFYFIIFLQTEPSFLNFELQDSGIVNANYIGQPSEMETDSCKKVHIVNAFKRVF